MKRARLKAHLGHQLHTYGVLSNHARGLTAVQVELRYWPSYDLDVLRTLPEISQGVHYGQRNSKKPVRGTDIRKTARIRVYPN
jgi:hypothetical protein